MWNAEVDICLSTLPPPHQTGVECLKALQLPPWCERKRNRIELKETDREPIPPANTCAQIGEGDVSLATMGRKTSKCWLCAQGLDVLDLSQELDLLSCAGLSRNQGGSQVQVEACPLKTVQKSAQVFKVRTSNHGPALQSLDGRQMPGVRVWEVSPSAPLALALPWILTIPRISKPSDNGAHDYALHCSSRMFKESGYPRKVSVLTLYCHCSLGEVRTARVNNPDLNPPQLLLTRPCQRVKDLKQSSIDDSNCSECSALSPRQSCHMIRVHQTRHWYAQSS